MGGPLNQTEKRQIDFILQNFERSCQNPVSDELVPADERTRGATRTINISGQLHQ